MNSTPGVNRYVVEQAREAATAQAIDHMRRHLAEPLQLADLARVVPFSPFHFHRLFRDVTTMTPARFLAALRMAEARRLLLHTGRTVTAISGHVGYTSAGTFTTQFSRLVGTTPGHFRQVARLLAGHRCHVLAERLHSTAAEVTRPRLTLHVPGSESGDLVLVSLRGKGRVTDAPTAWTVAAGGAAVPVVARPSVYHAQIVLVRADSTLTGALVDEEPASYLVGAAEMTLTPSGTAVGRVVVGPPRPTDPPALAIGPVGRVIETFTRLSGSPSWREPEPPAAGAALATTAIA